MKVQLSLQIPYTNYLELFTSIINYLFSNVSLVFIQHINVTITIKQNESESKRCIIRTDQKIFVPLQILK